MSDRELLELAAKAAGKTNWQSSVCYAAARCDSEGVPYWNPLTNEGDRYRLARSLKGNLYFSGRRGCFEIPSDSDEPPIIEYFDIGDEKAEAYAVVRAAATVGRNK